MPELFSGVSLENSNKRLDLYLFDFLKEKHINLSRTAIQKLIQDDKVKIKGIKKPKAHHRVKFNDQVWVCVEEKKPLKIVPENIPLKIIYEDKDLAVIDKPVGLIVHSSPDNFEHTLVNALLYHFNSLSNVNPTRPGIVHRLDKDTSGLLIIAKNNFVHLALIKQFAARTIKKKYIAIVRGVMKFDENIIELPIARHPVKRKNMSVNFGDKAKYAKTYYKTIHRAKDMSLLELEPHTGRTHQLRVHLAFLGHPILGDRKYGKNDSFGRLALHAKYIGFIHPRTNKFVEFSIDLPEEFKGMFGI